MTDIPAKSFYAGTPNFIQTSEILFVAQDGELKLRHRPYSEISHGFISFAPPDNNIIPDDNDLSITDEYGNRVPVLQVKDDVILISANDFAGQRVKVTYKIADDRVDSIMLNLNGEYLYEKSVLSTNPSHVDLADYENTLMIGVVYWHIDNGITAQFFTDHRSYRKVYVDENNRLYLNGKLYQNAKFIFFTPPDDPEINDIWYDEDNNALMIWKSKNGLLGWYPINDYSANMVKEIKLWTPDNMPEDLQTFMFDTDETNLRYVPNTNALTVLVDNIPLMVGQFEEIIAESDVDYVSAGCGFKLVEPLDHSAYVEVIVTHRVKSAFKNESFRLTGVFVTEDTEIYSTANVNRVFKTDTKFIVGEDQLEVFVDGIRLSADEFKSVIDNRIAVESDRGKFTDLFKVIKPLSTGQKIIYKINHFIWSYDQLDRLIKETRQNALDALDYCDRLEEQLNQCGEDWATQFNTLEATISSLNTSTDITYLLKTDKLKPANLDVEVTSRLFNSRFEELMPSNNVTAIPNVSASNDFIQVFYIAENKNQILVPNIEYSKIQSDTSLLIKLRDDLVNSDAQILIIGFRMGV